MYKVRVTDSVRKSIQAQRFDDQVVMGMDSFLSLPPADANGSRDAGEARDVDLVNQLIAWRKAAKLDQRSLAKLAGLPRETVNRMEAGVYKPRKKTLTALSAALEKAMPWEQFQKTAFAASVP